MYFIGQSIVIISIVIVAFIELLSAQTEQLFKSAFRQDVELLHHYKFKERIEVKYKDKEVMTRLSEITFDPDGQRHSNLINDRNLQDTNKDSVDRGWPGADNVPSTFRHALAGRLRHSLEQKKLAAAKDYTNRLKTLLEQYFPPDAEKLRAAAPTIERAGNGEDITLTARNYLKPGDNLHLILAPSAHRLSRLELETTLDQDPVSLVAEMASIPQGPTYIRLAKLRSTKKDLEIDISQFDFRKQ